MIESILSRDFFLHPAAWLAIAFAMGVVELVMPGYLFLGFATGAIVVAGALFLGLEGWFTGATGLAYLVAAYAAISLVSWFVLRRVLKAGPNMRKVDRDINEDPYKGAKD
jgi:membrane protein implicated in regulation of membrane protease activity